MNKQELSRVLDRAWKIGHDYFRSFSLYDWLGLTSFLDSEVQELNEAWLAFDGEGDFASWLAAHDPTLSRQYQEQLGRVWQGLKQFTNIPDGPSIVQLRRAHEQLAE